MSVRNISEQLFEDYLRLRALPFEFEKPYPGKSKLVDYTVPVGGRDFLFEVKQFEQKNYPLPQSGPTFVDPHRAIRSKIDQAKRQISGIRWLSLLPGHVQQQRIRYGHRASCSPWRDVR
jgi:hypothetical protein